MKKVLVTGGAGVIGSHLCKKMLDLGHVVICVDNLITGSIDNNKELQNISSFQFIDHDINIPLDINVEYIFNLACPASPIQYQKMAF